VHVGGTLSEIGVAERVLWSRRVAERPFVLLAQPTLFDPSRAPDGKHTAWGFRHVPNAWQGSTEEEQVVVDRIEAQIERFGPRFRERILARAVNTPHRLNQWNTSTLTLDGVYACSASRPPGGGVHGMVGYHAARAALRERFGVR
jgi:phytoene dehydrogenase-like protein